MVWRWDKQQDPNVANLVPYTMLFIFSPNINSNGQIVCFIFYLTTKLYLIPVVNSVLVSSVYPFEFPQFLVYYLCLFPNWAWSQWLFLTYTCARGVPAYVLWLAWSGREQLFSYIDREHTCAEIPAQSWKVTKTEDPSKDQLLSSPPSSTGFLSDVDFLPFPGFCSCGRPHRLVGLGCSHSGNHCQLCLLPLTL